MTWARKVQLLCVPPQDIISAMSALVIHSGTEVGWFGRAVVLHSVLCMDIHAGRGE